MLVTEDAGSMKWMMEMFKKHNSEWTCTRVLMADKDIGEREILRRSLPQADIFICLFHALRSFRREITCERFGITSGQRTLCLELIQKMAYAFSITEYEKIYSRFEEDAPKEVIAYMAENWNPIKREWVG